MLAQTPNLRFMKPLSKYMELRTRMFGRLRMARTYEVTRSNQLTVTLPFTPYSPQTLEIYHDSVRVLSGYSVNGAVVSFNPALSGKLQFIEDDQFPDMNEKWLVIPTPPLLHADNVTETGYGTDRREGPQIATKAHPVCITQGAIGFCRPSADGEQLLYCPNYGVYGRDSITYAIKSDLGQYSDFRCIDIRVRDPNYVPYIRVCGLASKSTPLKFDDAVLDVAEPINGYQIYGDIRTDGIITLPNKKDDELVEYHFVLQGADENGDWFALDEYFEPEAYELKVTGNSGVTVTYVGPAEDFGYENAVRISLMCDHVRNNATINLRLGQYTLFNCRIVSNEIKPLSVINPTLIASELTLDPGPVYPEQILSWSASEWATSTAIRLATVWQNSINEKRDVLATVKYEAALPELYNATTGQNETLKFQLEQAFPGSFTTDADPALWQVEQPEDFRIEIGQESVYYWETSDPFSVMWSGTTWIPVTFDWQIQAIETPEQEPESP